MARIRTKPRKKVERPRGGLIGCAILVTLGIAFVTWIFFAALNPN
jgi:hypothetical protein